MNIKQIVRDSLRYPLLDWKKFLFFGILIVISETSVNYFTSILSNVSIPLLVVINFILILLVDGYYFKIVKSSLNNALKPPEFDDWKVMFINGVKISFVYIIYLIPLILIILCFLILFPSTIVTAIKIIEYHPLSAGKMIQYMLWYLTGGIWSYIGTVYLIIVYPIMNVAVAHMAYHDSKLGTAFKFREIFDIIGKIGWKDLVIWYIVVEIIVFAISMIGYLIRLFIIMILHVGINNNPIFGILDLLIIVPYYAMFFARALALFYISEDERYLVCEKCGGYYELQSGESPEDFQECECGGKLKYSKKIRK